MSTLRSTCWSLLVFIGLLSFVTFSLAPSLALGVPLVAITSPQDGAVVYGQTVVQVAYRSDSDQPIVAVQLYVDSQLARHWLLPVPKLEGKQNFSWDFTFAAATTHTIKAKAIDAEGKEGSASIVVEVKQITREAPDRIPPVISIYYPAQGAKLSGPIELKANATDNVGVTTVFFYVDGVFHTLIMHAPPYTTRWDTTKVADGPHVIQAKAWDATENEAASAEVTVIVENRAMTTAPEEDILSAQAAPIQPPTVSTPVPPPTSLGEGETEQQQFGQPTEAVAGPQEPPEVAAVPLPEVAKGPPAAVSTGGRDVMIAAVPPSRTVGALPPAHTSRPPRVRPVTVPAAPPLYTDVVGLQRLLEGPTVDQVPQPLPTTEMVGRPLRAELLLAAVPPPQLSDTTSAIRHTTRPAEMIATVRPETIPSLQRILLPATIATEPYARAAVREGMTTLAARPAATSLAASGAARTTVPPATSAAWPFSVVREGITQSAPTSPMAMKGMVRLAARPAATSLATSGAARATVPPATSAAWPVVFREASTQLAPTSLAPTEYKVVMVPRSQLPTRPDDKRVTTPPAVPATPAAVAAVKDIKIVFDGKMLDLRAAPEAKEGISIAPLREIFEHTDGVLYWFHVEKKVHAVNEHVDIHLQIGNPQVQVNDQTETLVLAPYIKQGRTMVPLQFLADSLDVTIRFNPATGQVIVSSNKF